MPGYLDNFPNTWVSWKNFPNTWVSGKFPKYLQVFKGGIFLRFWKFLKYLGIWIISQIPGYLGNFSNVWVSGKFPKYLGIWEISQIPGYLGNFPNTYFNKNCKCCRDMSVWCKLLSSSFPLYFPLFKADVSKSAIVYT